MSAQLISKPVGVTFRDVYNVTIKNDITVYGKLARAATLTMRVAGDAFKQEGRANIRAGGLSARFANAWRVQIFPKAGFSIDAAVYGRHNIDYASIFQDGGTIRARRGMLWLPLPTVPKVGRGRQATPRQLTGVKLFSINRPGKPPLLAAKIRKAGVNRNSRFRGVVSLPALRAGANAEKIRNTAKGRGKNKGGVRAADAKAQAITVPLFHGVKAVTLRRRFDLSAVARKITAEVPSIYERFAPKD